MTTVVIVGTISAVLGATGVVLLWMWQGARADPTFRGLRARIGPFLDLLDARYLPLLAVATPQAYTVYAWLLADGSPAWVAVMGGAGFEFVYVGAIAWAERGAGWEAARPPAMVALLFSVGVAVAHYGPASGALSILHAGFPLVGYAYTLMMHTPARGASPKELRQRADQLAQDLAQRTKDLDQARADLARTPDLLAQRDDEAAQLSEELRQQAATMRQQEGELSRLRAALSQAATRPALADDAERITIAGKAFSLRQVSQATGVPLTSLRRDLAKVEG